MSKLYDEVPTRPLDKPTQLEPTSSEIRPGLKDCFRGVVDDVGGNLSYPQTPSPNKGEEK